MDLAPTGVYERRPRWAARGARRARLPRRADGIPPASCPAHRPSRAPPARGSAATDRPSASATSCAAECIFICICPFTCCWLLLCTALASLQGQALLHRTARVWCLPLSLISIPASDALLRLYLEHTHFIYSRSFRRLLLCSTRFKAPFCVMTSIPLCVR